MKECGRFTWRWAVAGIVVGLHGCVTKGDFDAERGRVDERLQALDSRLGALAARVDAVDASLQRVEAMLQRDTKRLDDVEAVLGGRLRSLGGELAKVWQPALTEGAIWTFDLRLAAGSTLPAGIVATDAVEVRMFAPLVIVGEDLVINAIPGQRLRIGDREVKLTLLDDVPPAARPLANALAGAECRLRARIDQDSEGPVGTLALKLSFDPQRGPTMVGTATFEGATVDVRGVRGGD